MQPKLLRVLEDREFERVGGNTVIRSDFRLIAATNQNLEEMISHGRFRKDLFYRLNVIPLQIPPLRQRKSDIIPIARHLLATLAREATLPGIRMDGATEQALKQHHWPGNARELSNVLERALSRLEGDTITPRDLPLYLAHSARGAEPARPASIKTVQAAAEKEAILQALEEADFNKARAADLLGIHRTLLYKKMKKHGIALQPAPLYQN